jgi:hypothetical protein
LKSLKGKGSSQADACLEELQKEQTWKTLLQIKKNAPKASAKALKALDELFGRGDLFTSKSILNPIAFAYAKILSAACPNQIREAIESGNPKEIAETAIHLACAAEYLQSSEEFSYTMNVDILLELHKILEQLLTDAFPALTEEEKTCLMGLKENSVNVEWDRWILIFVIVGAFILIAFALTYVMKRRR